MFRLALPRPPLLCPLPFQAEYDNHLIRRIVMSSGSVSTLAGTGVIGRADGQGTAASFRWPHWCGHGRGGRGRSSWWVGRAGECVSRLPLHSSSRSVCRQTPTTTSSAASSCPPAPCPLSRAQGAAQGWADGQGTAASFNRPTGVAMDAGGVVALVVGREGGVRCVSSPAPHAPSLACLGAGGLWTTTSSAASSCPPAPCPLLLARQALQGGLMGRGQPRPSITPLVVAMDAGGVFALVVGREGTGAVRVYACPHTRPLHYLEGQADSAQLSHPAHRRVLRLRVHSRGLGLPRAG